MTILHKFNDVSLRIKLAAMLTPLVIGLLIFIVQDVTSGVAERRDMSELNELTGFARAWTRSCTNPRRSAVARACSWAAADRRRALRPSSR